LPARDRPAGAFRQAQAALTVGSRIGRSRVVFDELGVVRLLFSDTGGSDLLRFVREALGSLIDYDTHRDGVLVPCRPASTGIARRRRRPGHTRPPQDAALPAQQDREAGLDLSRHPERIRASLALEFLALTARPRCRQLTPASSFSNPVFVYHDHRDYGVYRLGGAVARNAEAWTVAGAKARFSEMVDRALSDGPQTVTRNGREAVVVVAVEEWKRKSERKGNLAEFFALSPLRESELEVERASDEPRTIDL